MQIAHSNILLLGLLLLSGLFAGQFANKIGLPRVAAYVLIGILFSPDILGQFLQTSQSDWAQPLTHIALGIIAFIIGGSITTVQLQRMGKSMIGIALGESFGAVLVVFLGLLILTSITYYFPYFYRFNICSNQCNNCTSGNNCCITSISC